MLLRATQKAHRERQIGIYVTREMNRLKALYRSWAIPCAGKELYAPRHRAEWLGKIGESGVRRRAEFYYQQFDSLCPLRQEVRRDLLLEVKTQSLETATPNSGDWSDSRRCADCRDADASSVPHQETAVELLRAGVGNA